MKFLCLVDFHFKPNDRWLWSYIPDNNDTVDFIYTDITDKFASWGKLLSYYPAFLYSGIKAYQACKTKGYDAVIAWEGKNGFPFSIVKNITKTKTPLIVLAFSIRGILKRFKSIQRIGAQNIDFMTVPTLYEKEYYARKLIYPDERISFCQLGVYDVFKDKPESNGDFIFSGGRSGRDYKTFFEAISGTSIPAIVNARTFNLRGLKVPNNVQCNDILPLPDFFNLNHSARFIVMPLLMNVEETVGLSGVLYAMAAGKAVIASRVPGISDYVKEGETGLLVDPGDPSALSDAIQYLWNHPDVTKEMGKRSRAVFEACYTYEKFSNRTYFEIEKFLTGEKINSEPNLFTMHVKKADD